MNRCIKPAAGALGVTVDYLTPGMRSAHSRKRRRSRKRAYPGFRIRMMDMYVDAIYAIAQCMGRTVSDIVYQAILTEKRRLAAEIGMDSMAIVKLTKRERGEVRRKFRTLRMMRVINIHTEHN